MNWIKDNLIALLGCLCLILGLGWIISNYKADAAYAKLETSYNTAKTDATNAAEANKTNQQTIADLKKANEELIAKHRSDQAAAALAAERQVKLTALIEQQLGENARLREKLGQENPDVRTYLDAGMPCELARSLWPKEGRVCSN